MLLVDWVTLDFVTLNADSITMSSSIQLDLEKMKLHFDSGATRSYSFRREQLQKLKVAILQHEKDLYQALHEDLKKNAEESWVTEVGFLMAEINHSLRHLRSWTQPKKVFTNLLNFPSSSKVISEPL